MTFTNASQSFKTLNPHLMGNTGNDLALGRGPTVKSDSTGRTGTRRGIRKGMNNTEHEFSLILASQLVKGEISGWMYEGVKLKIGEGCFYTPDFFVWGNDASSNFVLIPVVKFIEVKGFLRDDARVKFLAAQEQHKWATFEMWSKDRKLGWRQIL